MKDRIMKITLLGVVLVAAVVLTLMATLGGKDGSDPVPPSPDGGVSPSAGVSSNPDGGDGIIDETTPSPAVSDDPAGPVYYIKEWDPEELVEYNGIVEHLFFHPVVCYPELAFDGDSKSDGIDDWMITVNEYNKILQSLYDNDYIMVNMNDVWSEYTNDEGQLRMKRNTLMIPAGKKPLIISYDDTNYYEYMLDNGFTHKLIMGDNGELWSYGIDPQGNEVISQELDAITIMDKFVEAHPDFAFKGAKGCLALTGYEGILGYRTNTDSQNKTAAFEENRQKEIESVKPIIERLKATGWYFGSHTWGHISLARHGLESVKTDTQRWMDEVGSLIGQTSLLFYPHGSRPDGDDVQQTGPIFKYLQSMGFRVFASVGIESYSKIKTDISAVICDRLHPDGTTLRWARNRYLRFYDAAEVMEIDVRPDRGYDFTK